jgi:hypothetical protein
VRNLASFIGYLVLVAISPPSPARACSALIAGLESRQAMGLLDGDDGRPGALYGGSDEFVVSGEDCSGLRLQRRCLDLSGEPSAGGECVFYGPFSHALYAEVSVGFGEAMVDHLILGGGGGPSEIRSRARLGSLWNPSGEYSLGIQVLVFAD